MCILYSEDVFARMEFCKKSFAFTMARYRMREDLRSEKGKSVRLSTVSSLEL